MRAAGAGWLAAIALLTGCGSAEEQVVFRPTLLLAQDGLRLVEAGFGESRPIPFGTPVGPTMAMVARAGGFEAPPELVDSDCPGGPIQAAPFDGGLSLIFADGRFAGWASLDQLLTTPQGVGIGSPRAQLIHTYRPQIAASEFGTRFSPRGSSGFGGILSSTGADSTVKVLWAGIDCPFAPD